MTLTILLVVCGLLLVSERADRVQSARVRAVSEAGVKGVVRTTSRTPASLTAPRPAGLYRGKPARFWAAWFRHRTRQLQNARRVLRARGSVREAIALASVTWNVPSSTLWSIAACESRLNPSAANTSSASGLFQILYPSTWQTTPYAQFDPFSAYANAMAGAYMIAHGRRGEWVC